MASETTEEVFAEFETDLEKMEAYVTSLDADGKEKAIGLLNLTHAMMDDIHEAILNQN